MFENFHGRPLYSLSYNSGVGTSPDFSLGRSIPNGFPKPKLKMCLFHSANPTRVSPKGSLTLPLLTIRRRTWWKYGLQELAITPRRSSYECGPWQSMIVRSHTIRVSGVMTPSCRAVIAWAILKIEPGRYWAINGRL